jgi:hypothetical protein
MKKIILMGVMFFAAAGLSPAFAQTAIPLPPASPWYLGVGLGEDVPGSGWNPNYYLGGGGQLFAGCRMDADWSAQLDLEEWYYTGGGTSLYHFRVLAEAKYGLGGEIFQPYLLAGPGLVFQQLESGGDIIAGFDFAAGAGAQAVLGNEKYIYLEAKINLILPSGGTLTDIPITAGLRMGI